MYQQPSFARTNYFLPPNGAIITDEWLVNMENYVFRRLFNVEPYQTVENFFSLRIYLNLSTGACKEMYSRTFGMSYMDVEKIIMEWKENVPPNRLAEAESEIKNTLNQVVNSQPSLIHEPIFSSCMVSIPVNGPDFDSLLPPSPPKMWSSNALDCSTETVTSICSFAQSTPNGSPEKRPQKQLDANKLRYKTEPCERYKTFNSCDYGDKCQYAHGANELRLKSSHLRYKTEFCEQFHYSSQTLKTCYYAKRCDFIHNETPDKLAQIHYRIQLYQLWMKVHPGRLDVPIVDLDRFGEQLPLITRLDVQRRVLEYRQEHDKKRTIRQMQDYSRNFRRNVVTSERSAPMQLEFLQRAAVPTTGTLRAITNNPSIRGPLSGVSNSF